MKINTILPTIAIIAIGLFLYNRNQITDFRTQRVFIQSDKVQKDIRIAQVTDSHSNQRIDISKLKDQIEEFNPHMIAFTGDLVDHKTEDLTVALKLMDSLRSMGVPVYFVEGNHEIANRHRKELLKELEDRNVIILKNSSHEIVVDENPIGIYGAEFYVEDHDYQEMLSSADRDKLNILLSHSPVKASWYADGDVDLILSGHTHGGQIRLPLIGGLVSPGQGLFPHYDKGLMELPEGTMLYIDSGIGNSVLPIRVMNPVQFSLITISKK
ncbi:metallophosphoesterase [Gudongella sp. DL1XJH-153]|uniref:metallophosphoesterase n=1 Tax=Gudongella sp. DL1XJH-153 TaxID=3409804 RepID=UPI003BB7F1AB